MIRESCFITLSLNLNLNDGSSRYNAHRMTARVYVLYVFQRLPQLEDIRRVADTAKRTFTEMRNHRGEMGGGSYAASSIAVK